MMMIVIMYDMGLSIYYVYHYRVKNFGIIKDERIIWEQRWDKIGENDTVIYGVYLR